MRLERLILRNFMSHAETRIEFSQLKGSVYVYGENRDRVPAWNNGAGKTAILYAITWALWGRVPEDCTKNDVISEGADDCFAELVLISADGPLTIVRTKGVKHAERVDAHLGSVALAAPVQESLERVYGISWDTYCNCVLIGPFSAVTQFCRATPYQRATLLAALINDSVFQAGAQKFGAQIRDAERDLQACVAKQEALNANAARLRADLTRLNEAYAAEGLRQRDAETRVTKEVEALEYEGAQIERRIASPPANTVITVQGLLTTTRAAAEEEGVQCAILAARVAAAEPKVGERCHVCYQPFSTRCQEELGVQRTAWRRELRHREARRAELRGAIADLEAELAAIMAWEAEKRRLEERLDTLKAMAYKARASLENRTLAVLHAERQAVGVNIEAVEAGLAEVRAQAGAINLRLPVLRTLRTGFGREIRNLLLDDVRSTLAYYARLYCDELTDGDLSVEFPVTTHTGREEFDVVVKRRGNPVVLQSGGERYRVNTAILLALRKAVMQQSKCGFEFLLIDEALTFTDATGAQAFARLMQALEADFAHILLTAPREVDEAVEAQRIVVIKSGGKSRVVING